MSYITEYNVAFPHFNIADNILHPKGRNGKHAICYVDEDIITLAYTASCNLNLNVDAVLFATNTPVFNDRYHASFLADLLKIPEGITALDFDTTSRCGTDALLYANILVNSKKHKNVLVVAADVRFPSIGKEVQTAFGHGAVAMIVSSNKGVAEISGTASFSSSLAEEFRYKGSKVHYDNRFARTAGFKNNMELVMNSLDADAINNIMVNCSFSKLAFGIIKKAGFDLEKQLYPDSITSQFGYMGSAHGLLNMISAIQNKKNTSVLIDYANGSNVITIKHLDSHNRSLTDELDKKTSINSYQDYLTIRKQGKFERAGYEKLDLFSSEMMQEREKDQFINLIGFECSDCGTVYYMKAARCNKCHGTSFTEKQLSKTGTVYSTTAEYYFPASFPPINMIIVDLDGGGRMTVQQTDDLYNDERSKLKIGDKVNLVLRKMMENDSKPNYFWKCVKK